MAKFYGKIGFIETVETDPGVYMEKAIERSYKGNVVRNARKWEATADSINSNLNINNSIIIIADDFAIDHSAYIRYAELMGHFWEVKSIDIDRPRLTLELGGVYERTIEPDDGSGSDGTDGTDDPDNADPEEPEDPTPDDSGDDSGIE